MYITYICTYLAYIHTTPLYTCACVHTASYVTAAEETTHQRQQNKQRKVMHLQPSHASVGLAETCPTMLAVFIILCNSHGLLAERAPHLSVLSEKPRTYECMYICMYIAICRPRGHHASALACARHMLTPI